MSFDLNIDNYKKSELEEMFELPHNYNSINVENRGNHMKKNITMDRTINDITRSKTIEFLNKAKHVLISELSKSLEHVFNINSDLLASPVIDTGNTFTIEKPKTLFTNSYPSEYFPGVINLNIDTRFRDN